MAFVRRVQIHSHAGRELERSAVKQIRVPVFATKKPVVEFGPQPERGKTKWQSTGHGNHIKLPPLVGVWEDRDRAGVWVMEDCGDFDGQDLVP